MKIIIAISLLLVSLLLLLSIPVFAEEGKVYSNSDLKKYKSGSDSGDDTRDIMSEDESQLSRKSAWSSDAKLEQYCSQSLRDGYKEFKTVSGIEAYTMLLSSCRGTKEFSIWCDKAVAQINDRSIKKARITEAYANLLSVCHGSGEVNTSYRRQPSTNNGAINQSNNNKINKGAIDTRTGEYYPGAAGGIINPKTGDFYPDTGSGYINPKTGEFMPKQ